MTRMTVNGEPIHYKLDPQTPLLWALRDASNLTGTKHGCDGGDCGACTVMVDGRAMPSCSVSIASLEGSEIVTIEGLSGNRTHAVQQAWAAEQVSQCGYCEPGFIMAIAALLQASPNPSPEAIDALPNICRCGAYPRIRKAIARAEMAASAPLPGQRGADVKRPETGSATKTEPSSNGGSGAGQSPPTIDPDL
jgi:isoquinoline 1-oxidoreductase alpha subunit